MKNPSLFSGPPVILLGKNQSSNCMTTNPDNPEHLAEDIAHSEEILEQLERRIEEIGEPAAHELRKRLEALKIEENALQRNFTEASGNEEEKRRRMEKVEALLHHIEREEASVGHEADFLSLGAPSSVSLAFKSGARLYDLGARGVKRILRERRPWRSPFVNRTYDTLVAKFHLPGGDEKES